MIERAIPWLMIATYVGAVVMLCVFAGQIDSIAVHGWRVVPR